MHADALVQNNVALQMEQLWQQVMYFYLPGPYCLKHIVVHSDTLCKVARGCSEIAYHLKDKPTTTTAPESNLISMSLNCADLGNRWSIRTYVKVAVSRKLSWKVQQYVDNDAVMNDATNRSCWKSNGAYNTYWKQWEKERQINRYRKIEKRLLERT